MAEQRSQWLQSELLKMPLDELSSLSKWLQEVVQARSAVKALEAPFEANMESQAAASAMDVAQATTTMQAPVTKPAATAAPAQRAPAEVPVTPPPKTPEQVPVTPAPSFQKTPAQVPVTPPPKASEQVPATPAPSFQRTPAQVPVTPPPKASEQVPATPAPSFQKTPAQVPVTPPPKAQEQVPAAPAETAQAAPAQVPATPPPKAPAQEMATAAPAAPSTTGRERSRSRSSKREASKVNGHSDLTPATAAVKSQVIPSASDSSTKVEEDAKEVTRSSQALSADHSELMSSLWSAFGTATTCKNKVTQAEQNLCAMQNQLQMAMQKAEEAFVAVQHWTGMVEQTKMEQMTFANMCYDPAMQAQAQQRVATAMQSHAFAQQSGERAMQHRQNAEMAMREAQNMFMAEQAEMKKARHELTEVVKTAEAFLKENSKALPQDKVQPLCALCTRFMSFAQQLGAQDHGMSGSQAPQFQGHARPGAQGGALHPLADYQQRVMILEQAPKPDEQQMDELFTSREEDMGNSMAQQPMAVGSTGSLPLGASSTGNELMDDETAETAAETPQPTGVDVPPPDSLAAYKNRLMEEASYLQAVFGGRKADGDPVPPGPVIA